MLGIIQFFRSGENLAKVDLTDIDNIQSFITEHKPDFLIHSAAQRFPDKMKDNPEQARLLNVEATKALASSLHKVGGKMLYISTDYVFDGKTPPYKHDSATNPLNDYGISKLDGEKVVLAENPNNLILRIPILYGPVQYIDESAVTTLYSKLADASKKATDMSDYEIRRPSHVSDIASIIHDLITFCCTRQEVITHVHCTKRLVYVSGQILPISKAFGRSLALWFGLNFKNFQFFDFPIFSDFFRF